MCESEGKIAAILSPTSKPIITREGTFSATKGTGKFEGAQGSGTCTRRAKVIGDGVSVMDWEGEFTKK
jgi:hypothetical protein